MRHEIHVNFPSFPLPTNFPCNFSSFSQVISMTHIWQLLSGEKKSLTKAASGLLEVGIEGKKYI